MRSHDGTPPTEPQAPLVTSRQLVQAKEAVTQLLDALPLPAYLFDVEPHADHWEVRIDFPADEAWQSTTLSVDPQELLPIAAGRAPPNDLLARWRRALGQDKDVPGTRATGAGTPSRDT